MKDKKLSKRLIEIYLSKDLETMMQGICSLNNDLTDQWLAKKRKKLGLLPIDREAPQEVVNKEIVGYTWRKDLVPGEYYGNARWDMCIKEQYPKEIFIDNNERRLTDFRADSYDYWSITPEMLRPVYEGEEL